MRARYLLGKIPGAANAFVMFPVPRKEEYPVLCPLAQPVRYSAHGLVEHAKLSIHCIKEVKELIKPSEGCG